MKISKFLSIMLLCLFGLGLVSVNMVPDLANPNISAGPKSAAEFSAPIVLRNSTAIKRGIETLNITFDNSTSSNIAAPNGYTAKLVKGAYHWNISLKPSSIENQSVGLFTPPITNATGYVQIWIYGGSNVPSGNYSWFKIVNNLPKMGLILNTTSVIGGQSIGLSFVPSDVENPSHSLLWTCALQRQSSGAVVTTLFTNQEKYVYSFQVPFNNTNYAPGDYYFNVSVKDVDLGIAHYTFNFKITNDNPVIQNVQFKINGVS